MSFDSALLYSFLLVFVRCSAMLLVSPLFGAQNTPLQVRIFTTLAIAGALTCALRPEIGSPPLELYAMGAAVLKEILAGLLIGLFLALVLQAAQMGGAIIDVQMGLGLSQTLNPLTGVPVTVVAQFKYMLAVVVFLSINAHHTMILAFAESYRTMPPLGYAALPAIKTGMVEMVTQLSLLALQLAAPVLAVSMIVDAGLSIVNKAVPQMQAMLVGLPAKVILGMIAMSLALPALTASVSDGVGMALRTLGHSTGMR